MPWAIHLQKLLPMPQNNPSTLKSKRRTRPTPPADIIPYTVLVVTGEETTAQRIVPALATWAKPRDGFKLVIVTDNWSQWRALETAHAKVLEFPQSQGGRPGAQLRWGLALHSLAGSLETDWIFVIDDHAFLDHRHVQRLLRSLSAGRRAVNGQQCSPGDFCGGAGWLTHKDTAARLAPHVYTDCAQRRDRVYDLCFSAVMRRVGVELVQAGEFCSQPPAFYTPGPDGRVRDKEAPALRAGMDHAVTVHDCVHLFAEMQARIDRGQPLWPW